MCKRFKTNGIIFGLNMQKTHGISLKQQGIGKYLLKMSDLERLREKNGHLKLFPNYIAGRADLEVESDIFLTSFHRSEAEATFGLSEILFR